MAESTLPVGARVPTVGRMVNYHQIEDEVDWPAMILEVQGNKEDGFVSLLQVFRPRGNHWPRAAEGSHRGGWSWPTLTSPSNHELSGEGVRQ